MFQRIWPVAGLFFSCPNIRVRRWNCTPFCARQAGPASHIRLFVDHIARAFARFGPSASNITGAQPNFMMVQPG
jgi:hypothetical protein